MERIFGSNELLSSSATITTGGNGADAVLNIPEPEAPAPPSRPARDPYRGVVLVLLAAALLGMVAAIVGGWITSNTVLSELAITLGLAVGILLGVSVAQSARARIAMGAGTGPEIPSADAGTTAEAAPAKIEPSILIRRLKLASARSREWIRNLGFIGTIRVSTAAAGAIALIAVLMISSSPTRPDRFVAAIIAGVCLLAASLAAIAARYLGQIGVDELPEAPALCQGSRLLAWIFGVATLSMGVAWLEQQTILRVMYFVLFLINAAVCYGLFAARQPLHDSVEVFPLDLPVLSALGSRPNIFASILDAGERQLGIDLRSTLGAHGRPPQSGAAGDQLCFVAWLSTSLTVVGIEEAGSGRAFGGARARANADAWSSPPLAVAHGSRVSDSGQARARIERWATREKKQEGPENVLWARQHAANEYTLLLGNGRDLITVDAAVQYRITDARAWRYHCSEPCGRSACHRLSRGDEVHRQSHAFRGALGERRDPDREHARRWCSRMLMLSASVWRSSASPWRHASAGDGGGRLSRPSSPRNSGKSRPLSMPRSFRNQTVPAAEASVLMSRKYSPRGRRRSPGSAAGEAWSFRTLESQYQAAPEEYFFRRRLETLEKNLAGRRFTVVDSRFQRDGGELWLTQ